MQVQPPSLPIYASLLAAATTRLDAIALDVAADIAGPDEDREALAGQVRPAIHWFVDELATGPELSDAALATLRDEGARMAREGEPLQHLLDRYLSAGWAVWAAAAQPGADAVALAALGTALLRGVDHAAAAIGEGYSVAEREFVARTASARREYLDELLDLPADDPVAAARVRRRAGQFGLDAAQDYGVLVADVGRDLEDGGPEVDRVARALARPGRAERDRGGPANPIATTRRGRLVVLAPGASAARIEVEPLLRELAAGGTWRAVVSDPVTGVAGVATAYREALETLAVAARTGRAGRLAVADLLLERALLADEDLARRAVDAELGAIMRAPRNAAALLATLEAWLAAGQNIRRAARALDVAPRTVAYRLARISELLGAPLEGAAVLRLASALELRRLLEACRTADAEPAGPPTRRAARRRPAPRGTAPARRGGGAATTAR